MKLWSLSINQWIVIELTRYLISRAEVPYYCKKKPSPKNPINRQSHTRKQRSLVNVENRNISECE